MAVDYTVIVVYLAGMLAMGCWGMRRAKSKSEFLVAGRRLGPAMYSGTMAAIVLGGASTIGGVGLGYKYGLSGPGWCSPSDIWSRLRGVVRRTDEEHDEVKGNRAFILVMGVAVIATAIALNDVVEALTVAYNLLVGGLLVPILGGLLWKRGTAQGALASVVVGGLAVVGLMADYGILANEPVYYGLLSSLVAYVAVSLATRPTDEAVLAVWRERLAGRGPELASDPVPAHQ